MRITQAYVSKSVMDFPFHKIFELDDYRTNTEPVVFFGMYRFEDYILQRNHMSSVVVVWCGQDALAFDITTRRISGKNVTPLPKVYKMLKSKGIECELIKPAAFLNSANPQKLGNKIYAYCPDSAPDYHGKKVIDELRCAGYEIIIGDGQWTQEQWRNGKADEIYKDVFVGLCLSEFAGGGGSIIEMGIRGIPVVTNVLELAHCHQWTDSQDVAGIIDRLRPNIGQINTGLANLVWGELDHQHNWLEI